MGAKLCIYIYINVHICIVIVTLQIIFYFFSLSFTSLSLFLSGASTLTSLFLSLVPHSQLTNLRSKLTITNRCRSKLTHRLPPKQAHLPINFRIFWLISGFWSFDLFNSLFDQWVMVGWWWWVDDGGWCWCLMMVGWWWWLGGLMVGVDWSLLVAWVVMGLWKGFREKCENEYFIE